MTDEDGQEQQTPAQESEPEAPAPDEVPGPGPDRPVERGWPSREREERRGGE